MVEVDLLEDTKKKTISAEKSKYIPIIWNRNKTISELFTKLIYIL